MDTNILNYGAIPNTDSLATDAIQSAIDECAETGGGRVTVPAGGYISGTVWLRDNVELHLEHGSVIKGSDDLDDYNDEDAYPQNSSSRTNEKWVGKHLIIAHECQNVAITGSGTLDGNGAHFFSEPEFYSAYVWRSGVRTAKDEALCRPGPLVCFIECKNVRVEDINVTNQPCWGIFLHGCDNASIRGLHTVNDPTFFNSDGIDIDCCRFVTVSDCIIDTGDDCIAIRGAEKKLGSGSRPCEFVTVTNCVLGSSSNAIRLGVGTGNIRHIRISNISITRAAPALTLQSSYHCRGSVSIEDVEVTNVSAKNCARVFEILEGANVPIRNVTLDNWSVETDGYFSLHSDFPESVSDVTLKSFRIKMTDGPKPTTPRDLERKGRSWFRAKNIGSLRLEDFSVLDDGDFLSAWEDGIFSFESCKHLKTAEISVNSKEYTI